MDDTWRYIRERRVYRNPWDGTSTDSSESNEKHSLASTGELITDRLHEEIGLQCGCVGKPPGGYCSCCRRLNCVQCYGHCSGPDCNRPIGICCAIFDEDSDEPRKRYCRSCYEKLVRRRWTDLITKTLLAPFIEFKN